MQCFENNFLILCSYSTPTDLVISKYNIKIGDCFKVRFMVWQNRKECPNRSTTNDDMADKAKGPANELVSL